MEEVVINIDNEVEVVNKVTTETINEIEVNKDEVVNQDNIEADDENDTVVDEAADTVVDDVVDNLDTSQFYKVLKTQLLKLVNDFTREIELSFDYIDTHKLSKLKKKLDAMNNNDIKFKDFYNNIYDVLKTYNDNGSLSVGEKVKTKELEFLSNIQLFGIHFSIFNEEKKNTKRTLINYLHEFYIVSNFLKCSSNGDSTENLFNEIHNMVKDLNAPNVVSTKVDSNRKKKQTEPNSILDGINMADLSNTTGIDFSPFDNLMKNNDIMSIANELSSEMSTLDIDPMSMMTSLMSGNLFSLYADISSTVFLLEVLNAIHIISLSPSEIRIFKYFVPFFEILTSLSNTTPTNSKNSSNSN